MQIELIIRNDDPQLLHRYTCVTLSASAIMLRWRHDLLKSRLRITLKRFAERIHATFDNGIAASNLHQTMVRKYIRQHMLNYSVSELLPQSLRLLRHLMCRKQLRNVATHIHASKSTTCQQRIHTNQHTRIFTCAEEAVILSVPPRFQISFLASNIVTTPNARYLPRRNCIIDTTI